MIAELGDVLEKFLILFYKPSSDPGCFTLHAFNIAVRPSSPRLTLCPILRPPPKVDAVLDEVLATGRMQHSKSRHERPWSLAYPNNPVVSERRASARS